MDRLNENSEEHSQSFNDGEEQDYMMQMLANASYHHFLDTPFADMTENNDNNNEKKT